MTYIKKLILYARPHIIRVFITARGPFGWFHEGCDSITLKRNHLCAWGECCTLLYFPMSAGERREDLGRTRFSIYSSLFPKIFLQFGKYPIGARIQLKLFWTFQEEFFDIYILIYDQPYFGDTYLYSRFWALLSWRLYYWALNLYTTLEQAFAILGWTQPESNILQDKVLLLTPDKLLVALSSIDWI